MTLNKNAKLPHNIVRPVTSSLGNISSFEALASVRHFPLTPQNSIINRLYSLQIQKANLHNNIKICIILFMINHFPIISMTQNTSSTHCLYRRFHNSGQHFANAWGKHNDKLHGHNDYKQLWTILMGSKSHSLCSTYCHCETVFILHCILHMYSS